MVSPKEDRTRLEFYTHLSRMGVEGSLMDPLTLDIDHDYPYLDLDVPASGATSLGSIKIHGYPINIINIVREKNFEVGHLGFGGDYGPIEFASNGWRLRFFITFYDEWEVPRPADLTEFHLHTSTKIEKGLLGSRIVDFTWRGAESIEGKTRIETEILKRLSDDPALRSHILKEINAERNITIRSYTPKKTPKQTAAEASHAKILIHGEAKKKKDVFLGRNCFDMYNKIAEHVLQVNAAL
jgi:hypothetical protein